MTTFDFKKERKDLYQPTTAPSIVEVPAMSFLMVDGEGDPNGEGFHQAIETLYSLAYTIRMNKAEPGYYPYVVPPSEGFWDFAEEQAIPTEITTFDKNQLIWTLVIRQPDFVTPEILDAAQEKVRKKKPDLRPESARLESFTEGLCVQALHLGPYSTEPATIQTMKKYVEQRRFVLDYTRQRRHHELYFSNPKNTEPDTMKTILRLPIRKN